MRAALLAALVLTACDDRSASDDAGPHDATTDAGPTDAGADASTDAGPLPCPEALAERRVALDRSPFLTQIHPEAIWDGEAIWVVYVRPEASGGGNFDVIATRVACDGRALVSPFPVSSDPAFGNDIDPDVAIDGDRMIVAWQSDDGTGGTDNLQVRYRLFDVDGTPRGDDRTLRTQYEGAPVPDNHMGVELATRPGGGFVVAGSRALPGVNRFTAYAQPLTVDGDLDGDALDPLVETEVGQTNVALDVADDGTIWVAYDRQPDGGEAAVVVAALDGVATPEAALADPALSSGAGILATGGATWVAFSGDTGLEVDLRLVDVAVPAGSRTAAVIGESARVEHSPRLARAADGTIAMAWFRQIRGFTNELLVAPVTPGSPPTVGDPIRVDRMGAPSYEPTLTHVMDDFWFLSYAEGESPDFRLVGQFVRVPPG